ncbi:hypothetical protein RCL_jg13993.t1 [Rhizophagus clarus]|uniref:Uncharacterized protein n=1 Tax=Rhizophagus clarus TaxID=94130 RepID=A0A8H3LTS3_9GLOM|nr:hypothetical protein RCL_jg13993.t1 [Rhizophagus clarus]
MMRFYTNYDLLLEPSILVQFKKVLMQSTCSIHPFRNPTGHWCQIRGNRSNSLLLKDDSFTNKFEEEIFCASGTHE